MNFIRLAAVIAAAGTGVIIATGVAAADTGSDSSASLLTGFVLPYLVLLGVTGALAVVGITRLMSRRKAG